MATKEQFSVIIADRPTPAQRRAVHDRVKKGTKSWWHQYDDVWIVRGGPTPSQWIDRLSPVFETGPASVLVLGLPNADQARAWGYFGSNPAERASWLHSHYTMDKR